MIIAIFVLLTFELEVTDDAILVMDNKSETGINVVENNRKYQITSCECALDSNLAIQIGDFKLEYLQNDQNLHDNQNGVKQQNEIQQQNKSDDVDDEDDPQNILDGDNKQELNNQNINNFAIDATLIIPPQNKLQQKRPPVPGFNEKFEEKKAEQFSFGDATQIIPPRNQNKKNDFDMPQPMAKNLNNGMKAKNIDIDMMGPTQVINDNRNHNNINDDAVDPMMADTQQLDNPFQREMDNDYNGATLIINPGRQKKQLFKHPQVPDFADFDDATQVIYIPGGPENKLNKKQLQQHNDNVNFDATLIIPPNNQLKQANKKPQQMQVDNIDATLIIPQGNQIKPQGKQQAQQVLDNLDATLIIPQNHNNNNNKKQQEQIKPVVEEDQSDLDRLLNSDDDEDLPRFGRGGRQIKQNNNKNKQQQQSINSSMDDLIDALDHKKEDKNKVVENKVNNNNDKKQQQQQLPVNKQLSRIEEDELLQESDEEEEKKGQLPAPKFTQDKKVNKEAEIKNNNHNSHGNDPIDSFDDILLERRNDKPQQEVQSQRYNKKRKAAEMSNEEVNQDPKPSQQSQRRRKISEEEKQPLKSNRIKAKAQHLQDDKEDSDDVVEQQQNNNKTILVSGEAKKSDYKEIIKKLGGKAIEDISENFDIMVTDAKLIRNCKLLQSINLGAKVVNLNWLKDSQKANKFIDITDKHLIYDKQFEKTYSCSLKQLYNNKNVGTLLQDEKIYVSDKVTGITFDQLKKLIESAGGEVVKDVKHSTICIMDQNGDKARIKKMGKDKHHVQTVHFIFDSIITQKLEYDRNTLI